jgi:hypothetical protein
VAGKVNQLHDQIDSSPLSGSIRDKSPAAGLTAIWPSSKISPHRTFYVTN